MDPFLPHPPLTFISVTAIAEVRRGRQARANGSLQEYELLSLTSSIIILNEGGKATDARPL
jgi:hypothetical protein